MEPDPCGASACTVSPPEGLHLHLATIGPLVAKSLPALPALGLLRHPKHPSPLEQQQQGAGGGREDQPRGQDPPSAGALAGVGRGPVPGSKPARGTCGRSAQAGPDQIPDEGRGLGRSRSQGRQDFSRGAQHPAPKQQVAGAPHSSPRRGVLSSTCGTSPLRRAPSISQPIRTMRAPPGSLQNQPGAESQAQQQQQDGAGSMAHNLEVLKAYLASQRDPTPVARSGPAAQRLNQDGTVRVEPSEPSVPPSGPQGLFVEVAPGDLERTTRVGRSCPVLPSQGQSSQPSATHPLVAAPSEFEAKILHEVEAALAAHEPPKEVFRKEGPWTEEEDQELLRFVEQFGARHWRKVPTKTRLRRDPQSCRLRWTTHLSLEASKQPFSPEEDKLLLDSVSWSGETKWTTIAAHKFPKRTGYQIHKRWMYLMEQQRRARGEASGMEHEPVDMDQAIKEAAATAALAAAAAAKARQAEGKISGKVLERVGAGPAASAPLSPAARASLVSSPLSLPLHSTEAASQRAGFNLGLLGGSAASSSSAMSGRPGFSAPVSGAGLLQHSPLAQALLQSIALSAQAPPQPAASPVRYTAGAPVRSGSPGQNLERGVETQGWRATGEKLGHTGGTGSMSGIDLNSSGMEEETRSPEGHVFVAAQGSKGFDLNQDESLSPEAEAGRMLGNSASLDLNSVDLPADADNDGPPSPHFLGSERAQGPRGGSAPQSPRGSLSSQEGLGRLGQVSESPSAGQKRSAEVLLPHSSDAALLLPSDIARRQKLEDRGLQVCPGRASSPVLLSSRSVSSARLDGVRPGTTKGAGIGLGYAELEGSGLAGLRGASQSEHRGGASGGVARMDLNLNLSAPEQERADPVVPAGMPGNVAPLSLVSLLPIPAAASLGMDGPDGDTGSLEAGTSSRADPEANSLLAVYEAAIDQLAAQAKHKLHSMLGPPGSEQPAVSPGVSTSSCPQESSLGGAKPPSTTSGSGPPLAGTVSLPDAALRGALGPLKDQAATPR